MLILLRLEAVVYFHVSFWPKTGVCTENLNAEILQIKLYYYFRDMGIQMAFKVFQILFCFCYFLKNLTEKALCIFLEECSHVLYALFKTSKDVSS